MDSNEEHSAAPAAAKAAGACQLQLQAAFDGAPIGIIRLGLDGIVLDANDHLCALLDLAPGELTGKRLAACLADGDVLDTALNTALAHGGAATRHEVRLLRRDGSANRVRLSIERIADAHGRPACLLCWVSDLEAGQQLHDMLQLANRALAASLNGVLIADASQPGYPVMYANPAFCRMTGYALHEVIGRNCSFLQNEDRAQPAIAAMRSALAGQQSLQVVLRNYRKDGSLFWNELLLAPVPDAQGKVSHYIGILNDITAFKLTEEKLAFQAAHDELTGLPNSSLFNQRLLQAVLRATAHADAIALLCLGIDNFKLINESLGHAAGDQLLQDVAARLGGCLRSGDVLSRHGGNEFLLLQADVRSGADVTALCDDIFARLAPAFSLAGHNVHASCSIGIALCPQDGGDTATLLRYADMALSRAREQGGGKYQFFASEMNQRTLERIAMETALRQAITHDELTLVYQPLVDLQTGLVCSVEALARWQHPSLGLLPAREFIPLAEEAGLIGAIGDWVMRRACHDMRDWRAAGLPEVTMAINISPRQFRERQLAGNVAAVLAQYGLPATALSLEIREAALNHDPKASDACLAQLKALGVGLALDDFGTGYSSLGNLKRYPFDLVKIDRAFISNIVTDIDDAALSKTIISMAHNMGIKVVAEGVETEAQCDFLRRNMCDLIQGYFFSRPMATPDIAALLAERRALPPHLLRIQKQKRTLLLVDDEQNIVASLKRLLRRDDYQIYTANSGQEGLDLLAQHQVDVIVSDQRMPGMIGADFLRKAKLLYPDTIRIMLSGYTELQSVTDAVNEGAIYKFLTKPWEDDLLRGHIAAAFHLKEISDENERLNLEVRTANHELASANRKMEEVLRQKQQQISRDEISLSIARELLQQLPLPVIGMDDEGMIAFINAAAETLFRRAGALLGNEASIVLPDLFPASGLPVPAAEAHGATHMADIEGVRYAVAVHAMGAQSASRGSLLILSRQEGNP